MTDLDRPDFKACTAPVLPGHKRARTWGDHLQLSRVICPDEEQFTAWLAGEAVPDTYGPEELRYRPEGWDEKAAIAQLEEVGM